jgi:hypothetical protein
MNAFTLKEPFRPDHIPEHAQWLAGKENAFWFTMDIVDPEKCIYEITCFEMDGTLSFKGLYLVDHPGFDPSKKYSFTHLSHYSYCSIEQKNKLYRFSLLHRDSDEGMDMNENSIKDN